MSYINAQQPYSWYVLLQMQVDVEGLNGPLMMERTRQPRANSDVHKVQKRLSSCASSSTSMLSKWQACCTMRTLVARFHDSCRRCAKERV